MYRSSSLTFVYKYLFTPVWGGIFLAGTVSTWNVDDTFSNHVSQSMALMLGWALIWLIILMIRLRSIEATFDGFTIKTFRGKKQLILRILNGYRSMHY
ncbi:MAG: hypothetical protein HC831_08215 [Chloroflexia bacterium]|nr:hypothetical protein [Chloroflexia bacterium]